MSDMPISLRSARETTIDALCRQFAEDALTMGELERRLAKARSARTREELDALLGDLRTPAARPPTVAAEPAHAPSADRPRPPSSESAPSAVRRSSHLALAVMGGTRRAGKWVPPESMVAVAVMGGVELDFRDAVLEPGVTDINCFAFWGGVEITVPPDVHVDTRGFALMGSFEQNAELETDPAPDAPVIRVNGFALMGGVDVKVAPRKGGGRRSRLGAGHRERGALGPRERTERLSDRGGEP